MIVSTKNIELKVTHEELDYGMGFLMDNGMNNDYYSNVVSKDRFLSKDWVGNKIATGVYYFEEKKTGSWISNSQFFGYKILCIENQSVYASLILKKGSFVYGLLFLVIPAAFLKAGFVVDSFDKGGSQLLWWIAAFVAYLICGYLLALSYFASACKKIKTEIETRLRIRAYHQQQGRNR